MKKIVIGAILAICGTIIDSVIILAASLYCSSLNSWSGSKLWYAIFGATHYGNEANLSLNLGIPFIFGAILLLSGIVILFIELYFTLTVKSRSSVD